MQIPINPIQWDGSCREECDKAGGGWDPWPKGGGLAVKEVELSLHGVLLLPLILSITSSAFETTEDIVSAKLQKI
ncbi:Hypothetical predicted protein [Olea europaea subsp. europaea]|uniref:Uncharacterized protein n=1 Tax=Olea europaea subsp. europaea TaxID=158383 RepID=A0A8S0TLS0_OLEEU|nr:Hypothetical predicted protein [Olea europaea subsp. europaea]